MSTASLLSDVGKIQVYYLVSIDCEVFVQGPNLQQASTNISLTKRLWNILLLLIMWLLLKPCVGGGLNTTEQW